SATVLYGDFHGDLHAVWGAAAADEPDVLHGRGQLSVGEIGTGLCPHGDLLIVSCQRSFVAQTARRSGAAAAAMPARSRGLLPALERTTTRQVDGRRIIAQVTTVSARSHALVEPEAADDEQADGEHAAHDELESAGGFFGLDDLRDFLLL